ncbi:hypothetical protein GN958_ATG05059 [Phytophthora infestans]|uniref:Uncharacterized protein n=1 Tax=Phytophthora infestans TaxID=4787 RepID=A0A8S9V2W8_PHYIN|nr:hypothetical protein GN958_ATG05059 [Phytophthora infestans]
MGRSQGFERQQFADTGLPKRGGRSQVVCRHCLAAYNDQTREKKPPEPKVISGRDTNYTSHLKDCQYFKEAQERGDVTAPLVQPTILHHFLAQSGAKPPSSSASSISASRSSIGMLLQQVPPNEVGVFVNTLIQSFVKTIMMNLSDYSSSFRQIIAYLTAFYFSQPGLRKSSSEAKSNGKNSG